MNPTTVTLPLPLPDSFTDINPLGLVPVLDIGDARLIESSVICEYLEDRGGEPALRPADPLARARMRMLIRLFELHYDPSVLILYGRMRGVPPSDAQIANCYAKMRSALAMMGGMIDPGCYAVGDALTLADCALMPPFLQASIILPALDLPNPVTEFPALSAYFEATRRAPHVAEILDDMESYLRAAVART